jgi:hypothetical protein
MTRGRCTVRNASTNSLCPRPIPHTAAVTVVEGMVEVELHLTLSALAATLTTRIAGCEVQVRLPGPPRANDGIGLLGGALTAPRFEHVRHPESLRVWLHAAPDGWGKCHARSGSDGAAVVSRCALVVFAPDNEPAAEPEELAEALYGSVDDWREVVLDWLETAHDQTLGRTALPGPGSAITPWLWTHDGQERVLLHKEQMLSVHGEDPGKALDAAALQQVFGLAGALIRPPLAWTLTRDASRRMWAGDYRRAVLDAGTAAEVALYEALPSHNRKVGPKETLGPLVKKATTVPALRQPEAEAHLVSVRNAVAHDGRTPTKRQAEAALIVSAGFVEKALPRSELLAAALRVHGSE